MLLLSKLLLSSLSQIFFIILNYSSSFLILFNLFFKIIKFQTFICDCDLIIFESEIVIDMGDMIKAVKKNFDSKSGVSSKIILLSYWTKQFYF